jgi:hypothetical protein
MLRTSRAALRGWPLRSRRTALAAVTTTTLLGFAPAHAQQAVGGEATSMMEIQEIVVTGSRIRRADTATAAPVTVIAEQALVDRGARTKSHEAACGENVTIFQRRDVALNPIRWSHSQFPRGC